MKFTELSTLRRGPYIAAPVFLIGAIVVAYGLGLRDFGVIWGVLKEAAPLVLLASGAGLVIATGHVDISTAMTASLAGLLWAISTRLYYLHDYGWLAAVALLLLLLPLFVGGINAYFIVGKRAPSLVVTWATASLLTIVSVALATMVDEGTFVGLATCGEPETYTCDSSGIGSSLVYGRSTWSTPQGLSIPLLLVGLALVLNRAFQFSAQCCAVGANWRSATYAGIRTKTVETWAFIASSTSAVFAGVLFAEYNTRATSIGLSGYELVAIAIAVLGGTAMTGGYYSLVAIAVATVGWSVLRRSTVSYTNDWVEKQAWAASFSPKLPEILFATGVLLVAYFLGERLSGHTRQILVDYKKESS